MKDLLIAAMSSGTPVLIYGPPGVGKTALIQAIARESGRHLETVLGSIREPADFSGLPYITDQGVKLSPPAWAQRLVDAGKGILFLDEFNSAPPATQSAELRVINERVVGDISLPTDTWIVAAMNPLRLAAGGWDLPASMANRLMHVQWEFSALTWADNFATYWGLPPAIPGLDPAAWTAQRGEMCGFFHARPELVVAKLDDMPEAAMSGAWPSPRSWDMASRSLAACGGFQSLHAYTLLCGCVGEAAAREYLAWRRTADLPSAEDVISGIERVPTRTDAAFAVLAAVTAAVTHQLTPERWARAWEIMGHAAESGQAGVAAVSVVQLAKLSLSRAGYPLTMAQARPFMSLLSEAGILGKGQ